MAIITTNNTINETNQIAKSCAAGNVPSGTDCTILPTIIVLPKKAAIIRTFTRMVLTQFILQKVYHPCHSGYTKSTTFILNPPVHRGHPRTRQRRPQSPTDRQDHPQIPQPRSPAGLRILRITRRHGAYRVGRQAHPGSPQRLEMPRLRPVALPRRQEALRIRGGRDIKAPPPLFSRKTPNPFSSSSFPLRARRVPGVTHHTTHRDHNDALSPRNDTPPQAANASGSRRNPRFLRYTFRRLV